LFIVIRVGWVSGELSIGTYVEVDCSFSSDVVLGDIGLIMVFDVLVDLHFCTLLICTGLQIEGLFKGPLVLKFTFWWWALRPLGLSYIS
jgi:hypothetical protein